VGEDEDNEMDENDDENSAEIERLNLSGSSINKTMDYMIGSSIIQLWRMNDYTDFVFLL